MIIRWDPSSAQIREDDVLSLTVTAPRQMEDKARSSVPLVAGTISVSTEEASEMKHSHNASASVDHYKKFTAHIPFNDRDQTLRLSVKLGRERCSSPSSPLENLDKTHWTRLCSYEIKRASVSPDLSRIVFVVQKEIESTLFQPYHLFKDKFFAAVKRKFNEKRSDAHFRKHKPLFCCTEKTRYCSQLFIYDRATGNTERFELGGRTVNRYFLQDKHLSQLAIQIDDGSENPFCKINALHFDAKAPDHLWVLGKTGMAFIHFTPQGTRLRHLNNGPGMPPLISSSTEHMVAHPTLPYLAVFYRDEHMTHLHLFKQQKNNYDLIFTYESTHHFSHPCTFVAGAFVFCINDFNFSDVRQETCQIMAYDLARATISKIGLKNLHISSCYADLADQLCCVASVSGKVVHVKLKSIEKTRALAESLFTPQLDKALPRFPRDIKSIIAAYSNPISFLPLFTLEKSLGSFKAFNSLATKQKAALTKLYNIGNPFEKSLVLDILRHAGKEQHSFAKSAALFLHQSASGFPKKSELLKWLQENAHDHSPHQPGLGLGGS